MRASAPDSYAGSLLRSLIIGATLRLICGPPPGRAHLHVRPVRAPFAQPPCFQHDGIVAIGGSVWIGAPQITGREPLNVVQGRRPDEVVREREGETVAFFIDRRLFTNRLAHRAHHKPGARPG
jgi:hypothetical protein